MVYHLSRAELALLRPHKITMSKYLYLIPVIYQISARWSRRLDAQKTRDAGSEFLADPVTQ